MSAPEALVVAARQRVARFDDRVDAAFDALRNHPAADRVFYAASALGDFSLIWLLLAGIRGLRSERDWVAATRMVGGIAVEWVLVNAFLKSVFRRRRPPWDVTRPRRVRRPLTSSFPSGHATSAFASAVLLADGDRLWPLYYGVAAIVAASRSYVKIHHASDVVGGMLIGVAIGSTVRRLAPLPPA